jgi:hypothetical protein
VREVDYKPPSNAKVKNEWSHISTPAILLYATDRGIIYVYIYKEENTVLVKKDYDINKAYLMCSMSVHYIIQKH